jgi:hypothetical protein
MKWSELGRDGRGKERGALGGSMFGMNFFKVSFLED